MCEAGGNGKLQSRLFEEQEFNDRVNRSEEHELTKKLTRLLTCDAIQKEKEDGYETDMEKEINSDYKNDVIFKGKEPNLFRLRDQSSIVEEYNSSCCPIHSLNKKKKAFPMGLHNSTTTFQSYNRKAMSSTQEIMLKGPQEGLILSNTTRLRSTLVGFFKLRNNLVQ